MRMPCNKPNTCRVLQFFAPGTRNAHAPGTVGGWGSGEYIFWGIGKNPKVFDKTFDEKS